MNVYDMGEVRRLPIKTVAKRLGIKVLRGNKAMCFTGHDKRTPSLSFHCKDNYWKCFGCGLGGDTIELVKLVLNIDFREALNWFSNEFHVNVERGAVPIQGASKLTRKRSHITREHKHIPETDPTEFAPDPELYSWLVDRCGKVSEPLGLNYLANHGVPLSVAATFSVRELRTPDRAFSSLIDRWGTERVLRSGLAWEREGKPTRLIWTSYTLLFPFYENGQLIYVQGRLFAGNRKYLNPRRVCKPIYNADRLKTLSVGSRIHICEGVPDALALEALGLPAVAVLGASSFREEWASLFMPYEVAVTPDGDSGGKTFSRQISAAFRARGKAVLVVALPEGKDVAEMAAGLVRTK